jgi:hypothetical protein
VADTLFQHDSNPDHVFIVSHTLTAIFAQGIADRYQDLADESAGVQRQQSLCFDCANTGCANHA